MAPSRRRRVSTQDESGPQRGHRLAPRFGRGAVDHQLAVEVVELVLRDARGHALEVERDHVTVLITPLEPDRQRMLLLAYYGAFSRGELAAKLDMPIDAVSASLRRSLAEIEQCLGS